MFWNSRKNIGILEFPRKFKKKLWNFGIPWEIPKKNFGILEFPRKFQKKNFGILEFSRKFQNSKVFFWNFLGNSKIPKFFPEFQNIFQKTLEFWNFGIFEEIPKFQSFFFGIFEEIPKFQNFYLNSKTSSKKLWNFGILEFLSFPNHIFP